MVRVLSTNVDWEADPKTSSLFDTTSGTTWNGLTALILYHLEGVST